MIVSQGNASGYENLATSNFPIGTEPTQGRCVKRLLWLLCLLTPGSGGGGGGAGRGCRKMQISSVMLHSVLGWETYR